MDMVVLSTQVLFNSREIMDGRRLPGREPVSESLKGS